TTLSPSGADAPRLERLADLRQLGAARDPERTGDERGQRSPRQAGERAAHLDRDPAQPERTPGRRDREGPSESAVRPRPQGGAAPEPLGGLAQALGGDLTRQRAQGPERKGHGADFERGEARELGGGGSI